MSLRLKQTSLLIAVQTACVGLGMWMHHRYSVTTVRQSLESRLWDRLRDAAHRAADLNGVGDADRATRAAGQGSLIAVRTTRTDADGTILLSEMTHAAAGRRVEWRSTAGPAAPDRGMVRLADGEHLAVRIETENPPGYLYAHVPVAAVQGHLAMLTGGLPVVGLVSAFWTWAVMAIASMVILGKYHERAEKLRMRASSESLRQAQSLVRTRDAVIFGLAKLADSRDPETGAHLERIAAYSTTLAQALRKHPKFASKITPSFMRLIGISSALHDIGKVGIEDEILRKPGALSDPERRRMQHHTAIGGQCLHEIEQRLGSSNFLQMAREIAFAHHERWDGKGYPRGLAGDEIPLAARIVAVADVYDALSSRRVYKDPIPHERCVTIIREGAGTQFDPDIVEVWLSIQGRFEVTAAQYADDVPPVFKPEDHAPAAVRHVGGKVTEAPSPSIRTPERSAPIRAE